ncbi:MAG: hypothetical protein K9H26_18410 [Prolixibacteraceae bacterium]|nr:hypothetical protein [Prolixibacteraceae bacterium]
MEEMMILADEAKTEFHLLKAMYSKDSWGQVNQLAKVESAVKRLDSFGYVVLWRDEFFKLKDKILSNE